MEVKYCVCCVQYELLESTVYFCQHFKCHKKCLTIGINMTIWQIQYVLLIWNCKRISHMSGAYVYIYSIKNAYGLKRCCIDKIRLYCFQCPFIRPASRSHIHWYFTCEQRSRVRADCLLPMKYQTLEQQSMVTIAN